MKRTRNKSRFPKDQDAEIGHVGYEWIDDDEVALSVDAAEAVNMRYFTSRTLCKPKANQPYMMPPNAKKKKEVTNQERVYTFDITQQEAIFDHLNADGRIKFSLERDISRQVLQRWPARSTVSIIAHGLTLLMNVLCFAI